MNVNPVACKLRHDRVMLNRNEISSGWHTAGYKLDFQHPHYTPIIGYTAGQSKDELIQLGKEIVHP